MNTKVMFSSESPEHATPLELFQTLDKEFGPFVLDPCATPENAKCAWYFTKEDDGLKQEWKGCVFLNPPYGNPEYPCKKKCKKKKCIKRGHHIDTYVPGIKDWMAKAFETYKKGYRVVCLVPSRTGSDWFQTYVLPFSHSKYGLVRFLPGRQKFGAANNSAPFDSVVVVMDGEKWSKRYEEDSLLLP